MADVKWIKIATDIFDDEKILLIESLPDSYAIITAWFKLLCLAGKMDILISSGTKSVSEIRNECRHQELDCIIIDYLQLVRADTRYQSRASEVGAISKAIKALAMELNVPIIALSQLNRTSEMRETKEPTMGELREAGDIEQDASIIILLWNLDNEDKTRKGLKVDKNRQGELGKIVYRFDGNEMRFQETEEELKSKDGFKTVRTPTPFD